MLTRRSEFEHAGSSFAVIPSACIVHPGVVLRRARPDPCSPSLHGIRG
jgi:hypothetical protein